MLIAAFVLLFLYISVLLAFVFGNSLLPKFEFQPNALPTTQFSVLIPFRNEAENLPFLLNSFLQLNYPKDLVEFIFVDDASEDNSTKIIQSFFENLTELEKFNFSILKNERSSNSPKKDAITTAIKKAKYNWIVTTDADCEVPNNWLQLLNQFISSTNPKMICGPVLFSSDGSLLQDFQQMDGFSLQFATMASFGLRNGLLSNGANLAYQKDAFIQVEGFKGNAHIASGDDIFLKEKFQKMFPTQVLYLRNSQATVITKPVQRWNAIFEQRVRWASKTAKQNNFPVTFVGAITFLANFLMLVLFISSIFGKKYIIAFLSYFFLKTFVDFLVLKIPSKFFDRKIRTTHFLLSSLVYPFVTTAVVIMAFFGTYSWKGRQFKKQ